MNCLSLGLSCFVMLVVFVVFVVFAVFGLFCICVVLLFEELGQISMYNKL